MRLSESILMVYGCYEEVDLVNFKKNLRKIRSKFPDKQIDLLIYEMNSKYKFEIEEFDEDGIIFAKIFHPSFGGDPKFWRGHRESLYNIFNDFSKTKESFSVSDTAIIFDIDGTLLDTWEIFLDYCKIPRETWDTREKKNKTIKEFFEKYDFKSLFAEFVETENYEKISEMRNMKKLVSYLNEKGYDLFVISAAKTSDTDRRIKNLKEVFGDVFKEVHCVGSFDKTGSLSSYKNYRYQIFIDDSVEGIKDSFDIVSHPILFSSKDMIGEDFDFKRAIVTDNPIEILDFIKSRV